MSKKGKLILATALFGAALFGASCGGGGGGGATAGTGTGTGGGGGGGGGAPSPTEEGRVLALLNVGGASAGTSKPVAICRLMSNNRAECGSDLNPGADLDLRYLHEFQNGNVLLQADNVLYFFDGSRVRRLDTYRTLTSAATTTEPGGITVPTGAFISRLPNLVMIFTGVGQFIAVAENGTVIRDTGVNPTQASCPTVIKGTSTYSISANGNVSSLNRTFNATNPVLASAGGKFLVYGSDNNLYLRDDPCLPDGQTVSPAPIPGVNDAQMVKVGNDFYIAVRAGTNLRYYKVSGSDSTLLRSVTLAAAAANRFNYTLDGAGRLYAPVNAANQVDVYSNDGGHIGTSAPLPGNVAGMLGFTDRVLVRDSVGLGDLHDLIPTPGVPSTTVTETTLRNHFNNCTHGTHTKAVDGIGTNFIRCLYDQGTAGGNGQRLSSIAFVGGQYRRPGALVTIAPAPAATDPDRAEVDARDILFGANALIVRHATDNRIRLCTTTSTTSPSISCSDTGVLNADRRPLGFADYISLELSYLKSNRSEVFYRSGTTLYVGDVFNPTPISSITASSASGGNASFDLTKFAFSFRPADAPPGCNTQIAYLSSRTASPKRYNLPSGTCVDRILKVY